MTECGEIYVEFALRDVFFFREDENPERSGICNEVFAFIECDSSRFEASNCVSEIK